MDGNTGPPTADTKPNITFVTITAEKIDSLQSFQVT